MGQVNIVLGEGFVSDLLSGPMQSFCQQYVGIKVNLELGGTNDVIRKISEDEGEIGLVYNAPQEPKLVSRAIRRQPIKAIVGPGFVWAERRPMSLQDLSRYPLAVMHASYGTRQLLQAVEYAEKLRLDPVVTTNSIAILKQFVKSGLGITVLPAFAVTTEIEAGELSAVDINHPILADAEAHLVTRAGRRLSVASNRMLQMMTAQMRAFR